MKILDVVLVCMVISMFVLAGCDATGEAIRGKRGGGESAHPVAEKIVKTRIVQHKLLEERGCDSDDDCDSGVCRDGLCFRECVAADDCASGVCVDGICRRECEPGKAYCFDKTSYFNCKETGVYDTQRYYCSEGTRCWKGECVEEERECEDSDANQDYPAGDNPFEKGRISGEFGEADEGAPIVIEHDFYDFCTDDDTVAENYCSQSGLIIGRDIDCPEDYICDDGACLRPLTLEDVFLTEDDLEGYDFLNDTYVIIEGELLQETIDDVFNMELDSEGINRYFMQVLISEDSADRIAYHGFEYDELTSSDLAELEAAINMLEEEDELFDYIIYTGDNIAVGIIYEKDGELGFIYDFLEDAGLMAGASGSSQ